MIQVAKISESDVNSLRGKQYGDGIYYNPIQDANGNWIVSVEESAYLSFEFELINYEPASNEDIGY